MQDGPQWDQEYDLVVIGAGAGGMTTALVAALEGLKPLVIEKTSQVGGTTATSAGTIWIPGNRQSLEAGHHDSAQAGATYMDTLIGEPDHDGLRTAYLSSGPDAVDYLRTRSEVRFKPSGKHPDYNDMPGSAVFGRNLYPESFDGRLLGADFERVRAPIREFLILGGMMAGKEDLPKLINRFASVGNFVYSARLLLRYLADRLRYSRGSRIVMGNALVGRLFYSLKQNRVPVMFDSTLTGIERDAGRVQGVVVTENGKSLRIRARKGVVIATGGVGHHERFRAEFLPSPTAARSMVPEAIRGDGLELGIGLGAAVHPDKHRSGAFWSPVSDTVCKDGSRGMFPHLLLDRAKPGLIAVNSAGRRFVNEACSYHDFVLGMYRSHETVPTIPAYLICEAGFVEKYGLGNIHPGTAGLAAFERDGYVSTAASLPALAGKLGIDPDALVGTVERYNELARGGRDLDFGKGDTELNRFNGDPAQTPNPCLKPIGDGPYVAMKVWPAEIASSTGLQTNADGQLLDEQGRIIDGAYAVGNDMASIMMGTYPGPGTTLGPALTFGYRIAMHAAGRPVPTGRPETLTAPASSG